MSGAGDEASERGRFAAREFLARWRRETGEVLSPTATDRLLFTYEMGYLRGRSDATREASEMFDEIARSREASEMYDEIARSREQERKDSDDDPE